MAVTDQHYVRQPAFLFYIRIAQAVLATVVLALAAFAVATLWDIAGSFGYNIFCAIYTWIVVGYLLFTSTWFIAFWNMWAALVLEIFGVIFWLSAFGSMAAWAAAWGIVDSAASRYTSYTSYYVKRAYTSSEASQQEAAWRCVAAAAGLGALIWVLFLITLITYSIHLHRHRTAPENANLPKSGQPVEDLSEGVGYGAGKHEMAPVEQQQQPQYYQQQQYMQ